MGMPTPQSALSDHLSGADQNRKQRRQRTGRGGQILGVAISRSIPILMRRTPPFSGISMPIPESFCWRRHLSRPHLSHRLSRRQRRQLSSPLTTAVCLPRANISCRARAATAFQRCGWMERVRTSLSPLSFLSMAICRTGSPHSSASGVPCNPRRHRPTLD